MNREDIIRMAREAGAKDYGTGDEGVTALMLRDDAIERFATLVAAAEREACAKVCESLPLEWEDQPNIAQAELATMMDCALAIRAREQK
jgi:hypothetical protein